MYKVSTLILSWHYSLKVVFGQGATLEEQLSPICILVLLSSGVAFDRLD